MKLWPTPTAGDSWNPVKALDHHIKRRHLSGIVKSGLSPEASPVRTSALRVRARESGESGRVFGLSMRELLASYDRDTQSWRTSERSLFGGLMPFSGRLPRSGILVNGKIYEQATWVLRTDGKESGSWPTPDASMTTGGAADEQTRRKQGHSVGLHDAVRSRMFPTPMSAPTSKASHNQISGQYRVALEKVGIQPAGQLNPTWVDWLMGYPIGWTDLEASGMQLSLRLQS